MEERRDILEKQQKYEEDERKRVKKLQEAILNKKNNRPRLQFSFGK